MRIQPIAELGLTESEIEILEECIQAHCHGFHTCAEIGVQPDMHSFVVNVFESVEEYEGHPTFFATRRYIAAEWAALVQLMTEGH
jgi:hypothetical protein